MREGAHNFSASPTPIIPNTARPVSLSDTPIRQESSSGQVSAKSVKGAGFFDALITVSLFAIFFGLPIFFTGLTFQGIAFEKQMYFYVWLLIGIVAWASKGVVTGEMHIRRTALDIFILLFLAVYGVSAILSVDRWHSFWGFFGDPSRGFLSLVALALAYYFIMSHFTMKRFFLMFGGFLAAGFLVVAWSILGVSGVSFLPVAVVIRAAFLDRNGLDSRYLYFGARSVVHHGAVSGLEERIDEDGAAVCIARSGRSRIGRDALSHAGSVPVPA